MKKRELFNKKELEILKLISSGYATPEIGEKLKYTAGTIDNYVKDMMLKTNTVNRAHLVYECVKQGFLK
jgi:DNA-binding CsgD family transcriptional regulator